MMKKQMKTAFSRKNLWEKMPNSLKRGVGTVLGTIPSQYLLGGKFRRSLAFVQQADRWPADRIREYQTDQLSQMLRLAYEKTSYYRRTFDEVGFHPQDFKQLEDLRTLPTINKDTVQTHLDDMCAVSPDGGDVDMVSTGGSSGQTLQFYINAGRSAVEYAYLVAGWMRVGYRLHMPQVVLRGVEVEENRQGLRHFYDAVLRRHCYSNFHTNDENMRRYVEHMATVGPCYFHAYPSSAATLARFLDANDMRPPDNIRGILCGSENVHADDRALVEQVFGIRYYSWYGHSEKLVLASECEHSSDYHIHPTYGFFELLDDDGHPVTEPGKEGEIVGTGFINTIVPFIRYRTGDYATHVADHCSACGRHHPIISGRVTGRQSSGALVAADGTYISMTAFNVHDDTFEKVVGYQFHQSVPGRAELHVVPAVSLNEADRAHILAGATRRLQGQVDLTLKIVDEIAKTGRGKQLRVISTLANAAEMDLEAGRPELQVR